MANPCCLLIDLLWKMILDVGFEYDSPRLNKMTGESVQLWSDLPHDLLSRIANGLGLIDFLSFRGVCRDWRVASKFSPQCNSLNDSWFLVYGERDEVSQCFLLSHQNRCYTINIPELNGTTTCLASYEGWLLLFSGGSLFFFCPFSRATIELPNCPFDEVSEHVAALSSAPTCQDCIVAVVNRTSDSKLELFTLRRGENQWVRVKYSPLYIRFNKLRTALFYKGDELHFLDGKDNLVIFNASETQQWKEYTIAQSTRPTRTGGILHYQISRNYFQLQDEKRQLVALLAENVPISTCGTVIPGPNGQNHIIIPSESIEPPATQPFRFHHFKGVWIQPRYFYVPPDQKW